jgi:hypothetical protein
VNRDTDSGLRAVIALAALLAWVAVSIAPASAGMQAQGATAGPQPKATSGYWMVSAAGTVYPFGDAGQRGGHQLDPIANPAVDIEPTWDGAGYWIIDRAGHVFDFGAPRYGHAAALPAGETAASLSATPTGRGYWIFTSAGRALPFGDAAHVGDMAGVRLNGPVLDSIATPSGKGYYMVASDGGVFTFGDARFAGSMGSTVLNAPVQSLVPDPDGLGYWLVASDGGIFSFDAPFYGSMGGTPLSRPVTGMVASGGAGYLMVAEDGGIFTFGATPFYGSLGANPPAVPIVSVGVLSGTPVRVVGPDGRPFPAGTAGVQACAGEGWPKPCDQFIEMRDLNGDGDVVISLNPDVVYGVSGNARNTGWAEPWVAPDGTEFHFSDNLRVLGQDLPSGTTFVVRPA